jgi:hypothetical protein
MRLVVYQELDIALYHKYKGLSGLAHIWQNSNKSCMLCMSLHKVWLASEYSK